MKDLFKNYHKHKVLSNIGIVWISFVLAISVNLLLVGNQSASFLKASVIDSATSTQKADLEIIKSENGIAFLANQNMSSVSEFSFSLAYDSENIEILKFLSKMNWAAITEIENESGFKNIIIRFENPTNIPSGMILWETETNKLNTSTTYINLISTNFSDSDWGQYLLSTAWIIF